MIVFHPDGTKEEVFYRAIYIDKASLYREVKKTSLRDFQTVALSDAYTLASKGCEIIGIEKVTCKSQMVLKFHVEELCPEESVEIPYGEPDEPPDETLEEEETKEEEPEEEEETSETQE